jgi:ketosteroid isomerase-like protein
VSNYSPEEQELFEWRARYVDWFNAREFDKIAEYYDEDSVLLGPGGELRFGPDGYHAGMPDASELDGVSVQHGPVTRLVIEGDLAYTLGCYFIHDDSGAQRETRYGRSLEVWRRDADGVWRDVADMWNLLPPGTEPAGI